MKRLISLLLTLVLLTSLVGCGKSNEKVEPKEVVVATVEPTKEAPTEVKEVPKEPITLKFSWWGADSRHEATLAMIKAFETKYPWITIEPEYAGWDGYFDKQATQMVGGTEADVMQINYNWAYIFAPDGEGYADLSTIASVDTSNWDQSVLDPFTINGKLMAVPASVGGRLFFFNKTTFDKAGVAIPKTWDELMQAGLTFKEKLGDDYYPLGAVDIDDEITLVMFMYLSQKYGKNIIENDKLAYSEAEMVEGFKFVKQLMDNHVIPDANFDAAERNQENPYWIAGKYAGNIQWNSSIGKLVDTLDPALNAEVVISEEPFLKQSGTQVSSGSFNKITMGFAVSKNSAHPEEAGMLINYMFTDPEAIEILKLQRAVPVNKVAFKTLEDLKLLKGLEYEGHLLVQAADGFTFHPYYEDKTLRDVYVAPMMEFMYGNLITPEEAAKTFVETFDPALQEAMDK